MAQDYGDQPVELVSDVTTMNSNDDPTTLLKGECRLLNNFIKEGKALRVREGYTRVNSATPIPSAPYSLGSFDPLDSDTPQYVVVAGGNLYASSDPNALTSSKLAGLTATTMMKMIPFRGTMLVNDPSQGLIYYDGTVAGWAGVPSPKQFKLIEGFESTTSWVTGSGTGTITVTQLLALHGRNSLKFAAASGSNWTTYKMFTAVDLTVFPSAPTGDGSVSVTQDYIRVAFVRSYRVDFDSCTLYLYTAADRSAYYSIDLSQFADWFNNPSSGVVIELYIRKSMFTLTGAGSWAAIHGIGFNIDAATSKTPYIICDDIYLEKSGPIAREFCKKIADFEADEAWTGTGVTFDYRYKKSLSRALKITGANTAAYTFPSTLDLTKFEDGSDASVTDVIEFSLAYTAGKAATETLSIIFSDGANTRTAAKFRSDIKTPACASTIVDASSCFTTFQVRKDAFTGSGNWAAMTSMTIVATGATYAFLIDSIKLVKEKDKKSVIQVEPSETGVTLTVTGAVTYGWSDPKKNDPVRSDEGSSTSLKILTKTSTSITIDWAVTPDVDLSAYASGAAVQSDDLLGPWIWIGNSAYVQAIDLLYDTNDGNFTDYYTKHIEKESIPKLYQAWYKARFAIKEHERIGTVGSWATICKVRLVITCNTAGIRFHVDQFLLERGEKMGGTFWYKTSNKNSRGAKSEFSNISDPVTTRSANVMLTNVPIASGCTTEIWRIGGLLQEWRKVGEIYDGVTTLFNDIMSEVDVGNELPHQECQRPYIAKAITLFNDVIVMGNLTDRVGNRYKSAIATSQLESFDEFDPLEIFDVGKDDGYDLRSLLTWNDRVYAIKERGIFSFNPYDLSQPPILVSPDQGTISQFSTVVLPNGFALINPEREVWIYNGATFEYMSGPIQDYLDAITTDYEGYISMEYFDQYLLISIPWLVPGTETTTNYYILAYYFPTQTWSLFEGWAVKMFWKETYTSRCRLLAIGSRENYIHLLFNGDTDNATAITGVVHSADRATDPTTRRTFGTIFLTAKNLLASGVTIKIEPHFDTEDSTVDITDTITSSSNYYRKEYAAPPKAAGWGTYLGLKLTVVGRCVIRNFAYATREQSRQ